MNKQDTGFNTKLYGIFVCWLSVFGCTLVYSLIPNVPRIWTLVPFAISVVLFGLPHGAIDHLIPDKMEEFQISKLQVISIYLVLIILYSILWYLSPVIGFVSFIVLTLIHWGQGDLYATRSILGAEYLDNNVSKLLAVLLKGSLPMLLPLAFGQEAYRIVTNGMVSIFNESSQSLGLFFTDWFADLILYYMCVLALAYYGLALYLSVASNIGNLKTVSCDIIEFAILFLLFALVDPILAVGLYFCFWHSLRHIVRLIELQSSDSSEFGFKSFFVESAPMTGVTITGTIFIGFTFSMNKLFDPIVLLSVYLLVIAIVTLPHFVVVSIMDYNQGVW